MFVGTLLWVENVEPDCATWKIYGDEHTILTDVSNYGVEWFGQSRPMYFVINQNLTIVKRLVGVWSSSNDYTEEITEAIEASLNVQSSSSGTPPPLSSLSSTSSSLFGVTVLSCLLYLG